MPSRSGMQAAAGPSLLLLVCAAVGAPMAAGTQPSQTEPLLEATDASDGKRQGCKCLHFCCSLVEGGGRGGVSSTCED